MIDKRKIEHEAREIQKLIWSRRNEIWPDGPPQPIQMLEPEIAAYVLGVKYEFHQELILLNRQSSKYEIAGLLDRQSGKIAVAEQFPDEAIRFTGAHEIGHWVLHEDETMHRDRPVKGLDTKTWARPQKEREADYFAACFLMPEKLVKEALESTFMCSGQFIFDDTAAFWLNPSDPDALLRADAGSLDRALALSTAQSYGGRHINSLAEQFRVSVTTMAIRLHELNLICE
jgi:Zn-dependent peptidase ImmA (M78 family)